MHVYMYVSACMSVCLCMCDSCSCVCECTWEHALGGQRTTSGSVPQAPANSFGFLHEFSCWPGASLLPRELPLQHWDHKHTVLHPALHVGSGEHSGRAYRQELYRLIGSMNGGQREDR